MDLKFENKRKKLNQIIEMQRKKTGKLFNFCLQSVAIIANKNTKEKNSDKSPDRAPTVLNTCHAWDSASPVVKENAPNFYTGSD